MQKQTAYVLVVVGVLCLGGCASTEKAPQEVRYTVHKDLRYGPHERHVLDLSVPNSGEPEGLILFIHGGIWLMGDKDMQPTFLDTFRDSFCVASMNHRYIDETTHIPDLIDDMAAAVSAVKEFCLQQGREPKNLITIGHSSGGHLALLYAYQHAETSALPVAFCVSMAGPTDLGDIAFLYSFKKLGCLKLFYEVGEKATGYHIVDGDVTDRGYSETGRQVLAAVSPLSFVSEHSPPTIIVHDTADTIVPYSNSASLHHVLNIYGVAHDFIALYSGIGHVLGAKAGKGGALRYDKAVESYLVAAMQDYNAQYCK
ncbi:MAG: alpha/beta hydrolase [Spirochaetaceae bacterium]|jgi:acetyl esterase/lipase|nr:alpha/beta hydrolase [Spirochaetaceae bacterium]